MEASDLLKKVRKIEIKTRGLSKHIFAGEYHSAFKGRGMAFSEVREYQAGDDIRAIDWNVTARFNHPYIKVFEEERELTVMLLIDTSLSKVFGTKKQLKQEQITEIAAVLSFSAIQNNDKVGVIFFTDKIEKFIPPKKGRTHILRIIRELIEFKPENSKTNIPEALRYFNNVIKKRSTAFIISDFIDPSLENNNKDFKDAISIANRKHDIVALRIFDDREKEIPNIGLVKMYDPELQQYRWVDTSSARVRKSYTDWWNKISNNFISGCTLSGVDFAEIATDVDYVKPIVKLFKQRNSRM